MTCPSVLHITDIEFLKLAVCSHMKGFQVGVFACLSVCLSVCTLRLDLDLNLNWARFPCAPRLGLRRACTWSLHRTSALAMVYCAWLALLRARPLQLAHCAVRCCLVAILLPMMLISINTNILTVTGRIAACVKSRAADTFADNRVAGTGLALQVPLRLGDA